MGRTVVVLAGFLLVLAALSEPANAQQPGGSSTNSALDNLPLITRRLEDFARTNPFFTPSEQSVPVPHPHPWIFVNGYLAGYKPEQFRATSDTGTFRNRYNNVQIDSQVVDNTVSTRPNPYGKKTTGVNATVGVAAMLNPSLLVSVEVAPVISNLEVHNDSTTGQHVEYSGDTVGFNVSGTVVVPAPGNGFLRFRSTYDSASTDDASRNPAVTTTGVTLTDEHNTVTQTSFFEDVLLGYPIGGFHVAAGGRFGVDNARIERELTFQSLADPLATQLFSGVTELEQKTIAAAVGEAGVTFGRSAIGVQGAFGKDYWSFMAGFGYRVTK